MNEKRLRWILFFFVILVGCFTSIWLKDLNAEQLLFNLHVSMKGANGSAVWRCLLFAVSNAAIVLLVVVGLLRWCQKKGIAQPLLRFLDKILARKRAVVAGSVIVCLLCANYNLEFVNFVRHQMIVTTIYQEQYVEPREVQYQFPKEKRNLIYIFLESMEVTYTSTRQGGAETYDLIPELRNLAQENINFSPNIGFGGSFTLPGTTWTMAAMVGQTSGLPLKLPFDGEKYYGNYSKMLPGAWTLGDILGEAGYHQVLMMGSDSTRRLFFTAW